MNDEYVFFWNGPFSQWYNSPFIANSKHFVTAEQYMMYHKALLFDDYDIADKILRTSNPKDQKALGRQVKNFDKDIWDWQARTVVYTGNYCKFTQNAKLKDILMATGNKTLVEASPYDKIWGIGLGEVDARKTPASDWPGTNWLGLELTRLRNNLREMLI